MRKDTYRKAKAIVESGEAWPNIWLQATDLARRKGYAVGYHVRVAIRQLEEREKPGEKLIGHLRTRPGDPYHGVYVRPLTLDEALGE